MTALARPWRFPFTDLLARSSAGGSGPVFPVVRSVPGPRGPLGRTQRLTPRFEPFRSDFAGPVFGALEAQVSEQTRPRPVASTGGRSGHSGTLQGATGGYPKHTRAEQDQS